MVAAELLSVTCLLWETCLPMQFNKHFLSVYGTQVIWGRGGVGGRMKGVRRNTKRNRVPELVSFKTDGEWHILRQLTVEPEWNQCQKEGWGIHYGSWRGSKDPVIQHRRAESWDVCFRPWCMRRNPWVRNGREDILSLKEPHLGYPTNKFLLTSS